MENSMSYEEWFKNLVDLAASHRINKMVESTEMVRGYWRDGYSPAIALKFMFPEYWRF